MKLPYTEVKFYPEVKSQTGLSSLRVSCKRALPKKRENESERPELEEKMVDAVGRILRRN